MRATIRFSSVFILFFQKLFERFACLSFTLNLELILSISTTYLRKAVLLEFYWDDVYHKNKLERVLIPTILNFFESMVCISIYSSLVSCPLVIIAR